MTVKILGIAVIACISAFGDEQPSVTFTATDFPPFPLTFSVAVENTNRFAIERTEDLNEWHKYINVFTRLQSFRFADWSRTNTFTSAEYFRASGRIELPSDAAAAWSGFGYVRYRFNATRVCGCNPNTLTATVTVENGNVVAVENAVFAGQPYPAAKLSDFKSVEELFSMMEAELASADRLTVRFDSVRHFPLWLEIDRIYAAADDEYRYQITDLVQLP